MAQLRLALGEGEIPAHWAYDAPPPGNFLYGPEPLFSSDPVPRDAYYWHSVLIILDGDGRVIDQAFSGEEKDIRPRHLFLLHARVLEFWPQTNRTGKTGKKAVPSIHNIRESARKIYKTSGTKRPPNLAKAEQLIRADLGSAPRPLVRQILREHEFATKRLLRGNQPKD